MEGSEPRYHVIVGGLYEVHNLLGAGYVHRIYCHACDHEMSLTGLDSKLQKRMQATYKDVVLGDIAFGHLLVEGDVMVFPVAVGGLRSIHLENIKRWIVSAISALAFSPTSTQSASKSNSSEHKRPHPNHHISHSRSPPPLSPIDQHQHLCYHAVPCYTVSYSLQDPSPAEDTSN